MKSWKSPFRQIAGSLGRREEQDEEGQSASIARLRTVMAELKVGDAEYDARNPVTDEDVMVGPVATATAAKPAAAAVAPPPPAPPKSAATPAAPAPAPPSDDPLAEAHRLIAEQRKAAEALLREACALEDRLKTESVVSQAFEEVDEAQRALDAAAASEQQAKDAARVAAEQRGAIAAERRDAESQVVAARGEVKTAKAKVADLEQKLRDARQAVEQAISMVGLREARVKECLAKETASKRDTTETNSRVLACESARLAAERKLEAARRRAAEMQSQTDLKAAPGIEGVQLLAARIAEQKSAIRNGSQQRAS
jgi:hypothetical protein